MTGERPVLFVTNYAPPERVRPFALLSEREDVEFALFGGRLRHGAGDAGELPFPHRRVRERDVHGLAAGGGYRAVVAGTTGRVALPAAYAGARRARVPFVLWASLWAHPRSPAGIAGWPVLAWIYRRSDAVVTYGEHVSAYVRRHGARDVYEAPQAVDNEFWSAALEGDRRAGFQVVYAGRLVGEKGIETLLAAWRRTGLNPPDGALVLVGDGPLRSHAEATPGVVCAGTREPAQVRNFLAGSDVLVLPSVPTPNFLEPWGLAVNEAMNQGLAVISSEAVGAAAGGLVRDGGTGLVVPPGDEAALAAALERLRGDEELRARLGAAGREAVRVYTPELWASGFCQALQSLSLAKGVC